MHLSKFLLAAAVALSLAGVADAKEKGLPQCDAKTQVAKPNAKGVITGDEREKKGCQIAIKELHPTQPVVGMDAVQCKAEKLTAKYQAKPSKFEKYLADPERFVPMVRGPGGVFYLTDHHHLAAGVWNADVPKEKKVVNAYLLADWSSLKADDFWTLMKANNNTWLQEPSGKEITPAQLPASIAKLVDDPLRTLSAWVRNSCGYVKCDATSDDAGDDEEQTCAKQFPQVKCASAFFLEFAWGAYLGSIPEVQAVLQEPIACLQETVLTSACLNTQYDKLVAVLPAAMKAAADPAAKAVGGADGGYNPTVQEGEPEPKHCAAQ